MYLEEEVIVEIRTGNGGWDATESDLTLQFKSDKVYLILISKLIFLMAIPF